MAIAKNPKRKKDQTASAFISEATLRATHTNKKPIMIRVEPELLERIDACAKRLGLSRSGFFVSSAAQRVETMS